VVRRAQDVAVVTGAAHGLGLALCRRLVETGWYVVGWCRDEAAAADLTRMVTEARSGQVVGVDVTDSDAISAAVARHPGNGRVDLLVNNAGIGFPKHDRAGAEGPVDRLRANALLRVLEVNAVAPLMVTQALATSLTRAPRGATVVNITSDLGSVSTDVPGGGYAYAMSKAALNMATRKLAVDLRESRVTVVAVHPGSVRTRMGGSAATDEPDVAAAAIVELVTGLGPLASGSLLARDGSALPW
jgi:NAD(P)-dependent dehydrogenase (short-subunit alcohol dehydrogenase family)